MIGQSYGSAVRCEVRFLTSVGGYRIPRHFSRYAESAAIAHNGHGGAGDHWDARARPGANPERKPGSADRPREPVSSPRRRPTDRGPACVLPPTPGRCPAVGRHRRARARGAAAGAGTRQAPAGTWWRRPPRRRPPAGPAPRRHRRPPGAPSSTPSPAAQVPRHPPGHPGRRRAHQRRRHGDGREHRAARTPGPARRRDRRRHRGLPHRGRGRRAGRRPRRTGARAARRGGARSKEAARRPARRYARPRWARGRGHHRDAPFSVRERAHRDGRLLRARVPTNDRGRRGPRQRPSRGRSLRGHRRAGVGADGVLGRDARPASSSRTAATLPAPAAAPRAAPGPRRPRRAPPRRASFWIVRDRFPIAGPHT